MRDAAGVLRFVRCLVRYWVCRWVVERVQCSGRYMGSTEGCH